MLRDGMAQAVLFTVVLLIYLFRFFKVVTLFNIDTVTTCLSTKHRHTNTHTHTKEELLPRKEIYFTACLVRAHHKRAAGKVCWESGLGNSPLYFTEIAALLHASLHVSVRPNTGL